MIDDLFTGNVLGVQADIASGELRQTQELRQTLNHLVGDYYVPPRFQEQVALHLVKNVLAERSSLSGVPLILGIWGGKGCGKSFNISLCCQSMGVEPIVMSAGELEDESAGAPGRRIRERYRAASQTIRNSGVMSCLVINDLDAGAGRFRDTQCTVNNQIVNATLMNLCDHPQRASVGEAWREDQTLRRVPIIVTGNDLSTLYAPLIRDGRMALFYWQPDREELCAMVHAMYRDDGLSPAEVQMLLAAFPGQPLDFFGALRARRFDGVISEWLCGLESEKELGRRLMAFVRDEEAGAAGLPDFSAAQQTPTLDVLLQEGERLAEEQEHVNRLRLSDAYLKTMRRVERGATLAFG